ncbi:MAG: VOC family protein, partial [Alphaproteobacteria bacterium]|nr:VOC family protein [Alphaproteobacteria bacterium]
HFEFTTGPRPTQALTPDPDDLIVFYLPDRQAWRAAVERLTARGHVPVAPANPYWAERGVTFVDPDGRRLVLENDAWRR